MRIALTILFAAMTLTACGGTEHKTVVVTPPPNSTTVVDENGHTHVVEPDR